MTLPFGSTQFVNGVPQAPAQLGGSGRSYFNVPDAIAGETALVTSGVTVAGTTNGVVVGPAGFAAVNLVGRWVVLVDAAPGNGKAAIYARVIAQAGSTLTIDSPLDFGVGFAVDVVEPAVVDMNKDQVGNVTIAKSCILNMGGCKIKGQLNVTGGAFVWVRYGEISDGILDSRAVVGVIRHDSMVVSARGGTIYAFKKTSAVNVGAVEAYNTEFRGIVAGTQGIGRWVIENDRNLGKVDGVGNTAYRILEASGIARTFSNLAVTIDGDFDGSIFFAEAAGSIVSAAPNFLNLDADMRCIMGGDPKNVVQSPRQFSVLEVTGAATAVVTASAGRVAITTGGINSIISGTPDDPNFALNFALLRARDSSGSGTLTLSMPDNTFLDFSAFGGASSLVTVDGTGTSSGTYILNGASLRDINLGNGYFSIVLLMKGLVGTGSITVADGNINTKGGQYWSAIYFLANQTAGTPTVIISPTLEIEQAVRIDQFGFDTAVTAVSVGTWTLSSNMSGGGIALLNPLGTLPLLTAPGITGGAWSVTGGWNVNFDAALGSSVGVAAAFASGTATLTVSGIWRLKGGTHLNARVNHARSNGGTSCTVTRAGKTFLTDMTFRGAFAFLFAEVATSVVAGGGDIEESNCIFETTGMNLTNSAVVGASVTVPGTTNLRYCEFAGTFNLRFPLAGFGTFVGAGSVFMNYDELVGAFTIRGTNFPVVIGEMCQFLADPAALIFDTVDPATTFRFNKCSFPNGRYYAINGSLTLGKPTIVDEEIVSDAGAATTNEFAGTYDGTARLINLPSASSNVAGVFLEAAGAAGVRQRAIVHGFGFLVADDATVAAQGDSVSPGAVVAGRVETSVVKRIGYALDAVAFPVTVGVRLYARIHVDR